MWDGPLIFSHVLVDKASKRYTDTTGDIGDICPALQRNASASAV